MLCAWEGTGDGGLMGGKPGAKTRPPSKDVLSALNDVQGTLHMAWLVQLLWQMQQ